MRRIARIVCFAALANLLSCAKREPAAATIPDVSVDELAACLVTSACTAVDANTEATRKKQGVIPGAALLSSFDTYPATQLPQDANCPLVFYCANQQCGASHAAAARARTLGRRDVRVLPAGIAGWVGAGKPTSPL